MKNTKVYLLCRLSLLSAAAIALSALDGIFAPLLPPGAKAGISNTVVMLSAKTLGLPSTLVIVLLKSLFALLTRGVVSGFLSVLGGLFSALLLWALFRYTRVFGVFGISLLGAVTHSALQLLGSYLLYGAAVLAYAPILLSLSLPSGLITAALLRATEAVLLRQPNTTERKQTDEDSL